MITVDIFSCDKHSLFYGADEVLEFVYISGTSTDGENTSMHLVHCVPTFAYSVATILIIKGSCGATGCEEALISGADEHHL